MYETFDRNGYNPCYGIYKSRYYAKKEARSDEIIVKVEGGYKIMKITDWVIWKHQK